MVCRIGRPFGLPLLATIDLLWSNHYFFFFQFQLKCCLPQWIVDCCHMNAVICCDFRSVFLMEVIKSFVLWNWLRKMSSVEFWNELSIQKQLKISFMTNSIWTNSVWWFNARRLQSLQKNLQCIWMLFASSYFTNFSFYQFE